MRWLMLFFWIALCMGVGILGARWTAPAIPTWYQTLVRPRIAPPNWVFGPVWTLLYILMAVAAWLVSESRPTSLRTVCLLLFVVQLAFNFAWSWIFFHRHAIGAALLEVAALWILIVLTTLLFSRTSTAAAWLMTPYLAWVTFATLLNLEYWRLN